MSPRRRGRWAGIRVIEGIVLVLTLLIGVIALGYINAATNDSRQIATLQWEVANLTAGGPLETMGAVAPGRPVSMNQTTTVRHIIETWYLSPESKQDRFEPAFPLVNQGDTVVLTFVNNDTVAHDLVIGPPYNIVVNATVPGLVNDMTGQTFKTNATNNSPGVVVRGFPGNVSATLTFVATFAGVFEFECTYHAQAGMIGYLTVLPNEAYRT